MLKSLKRALAALPPISCLVRFWREMRLCYLHPIRDWRHYRRDDQWYHVGGSASDFQSPHCRGCPWPAASSQRSAGGSP